MKQSLADSFRGTLTQRQAPDAGMGGDMMGGGFSVETKALTGTPLEKVLNWRPTGRIPPSLDGAINAYAQAPSRSTGNAVQRELGKYSPYLHPDDWLYIRNNFYWH